MNDDNLFDLIIGQVDGTITYAENTQLLIVHSLVLLLMTLEVYQSTMMRVYMGLVPYVFEQENQINILIGSESGRIYHYKV